jgi:alpha-glucosidase
MWTDIDYMELRKVFTLDPERFPLHLVRELVEYLHAHQQHYIVMVDPAVARSDNQAYNDGVDMDIFQKTPNGSIYTGAVWPGPTVFPDWFHPSAQDYWNKQFLRFFDPDTGVDIDALWIDMNEAANFCPYPCADPEGKGTSLLAHLLQKSANIDLQDIRRSQAIRLNRLLFATALVAPSQVFPLTSNPPHR